MGLIDSAAADYPISGAGRERPLLATWILVALAAWIPLVTLLPVAGYLLRVLVASERGEAAPRLLERPRALLRDGAVTTLLAVAVLAAPVGLLALTIEGARRSSALAPDGVIGLTLVGTAATVALGVAAVGAYVFPLLALRYGRTGSLRDAVAIGEIAAVGGHWAYFVGWTAGVVVLAVAAALAAGIAGLTPIGPLAGALCLSYGAILAAHHVGRAVRRTS